MSTKKTEPTEKQIEDLSPEHRKEYHYICRSGCTKAEAYNTLLSYIKKRASKKKISKKKTTKKKTQKKKVVKKKVGKKKPVKPETNQTEPKKKSRGGKNYVKTGEGSGGARKGAATKKTREAANRLASDGELLPLDYLLSVLRETTEKLKAKFDAGEIDSAEYIVELQAMQKRKDNAAEKAAPYIHARLSSIEAKINDNAHERWLALMEEE